MIGRYVAVLIVFIMFLVNTVSVIAQSQNVTNEIGIGENQSISGNINISAIVPVRNHGPRSVEDPDMGNSEIYGLFNETELYATQQ